MTGEITTSPADSAPCKVDLNSPPKSAPPPSLTSIDHGAGRLSRRAAGMMKARGVKAGLPDIPLFEPSGNGVVAIGIELKSAEGRLSEDQKATHGEMIAAGVCCRLARAIEHVEDILVANGVRVSARIMAAGGLVGRGGAMVTASSIMSNPLHALALPAFSPHIVGETVYFAGKAAGRIEDVAQAFGITADAVRAAAQGDYQAGRAAQLGKAASGAGAVKGLIDSAWQAASEVVGQTSPPIYEGGNYEKPR